MMKPIIQVQGLRKLYGSTLAVDDLSFEVQEGEIFGIVGPNGAGKTTTIECLEGLRQADAGILRVLGVDPWLNKKLLRQCTGIQLQQSNLQDRIKVWEALDLFASFYPHAIDWKTLMAQLGLEEKQDTAFARLSGGQKQRLFIALALLPDPQLVFLDELTTGLDPQARHNIWEMVQGVRARGKTVLLTTHFMEEAQRLCDRVAILDRGRLVALDTPQALIHSLGSQERVIFNVDVPLPAEFIEAISSVAQVEIQGVRVVVSASQGQKISLVSEVVRLLTEKGISFQDLRTEQPELEDVYLSLTGHSLRD